MVFCFLMLGCCLGGVVGFWVGVCYVWLRLLGGDLLFCSLVWLFS